MQYTEKFSDVLDLMYVDISSFESQIYNIPVLNIPALSSFFSQRTYLFKKGYGTKKDTSRSRYYYCLTVDVIHRSFYILSL